MPGVSERHGEAMTDLLSQNNLQAMKSLGYQIASRAREKGEDTGTPLAFVGLVTIALGATMLMKGMEKSRGR